ncbi:MAG: hypothetical protein V9E81_04585 [Marmoricola sp.]
MTKDQLLIVLIAGAWSLGTVLLGLLLAWAALRRRSFRSQLGRTDSDSRSGGFGRDARHGTSDVPL